MGLVAGLMTLGDANIARVLADPPLVRLVLAPDDPESYAEARADWNLAHGLPLPDELAVDTSAPPPAAAPVAKPGLLARLFGLGRPRTAPATATRVTAAAPPRANDPAAAALVLTRGEGEHCYLDKAWHGLHYLLTGDSWGGTPPLDFLASGGTPVADEVIGDDIPRLLTAAQVRALAAALAPIDAAVLRARFDPAAMMAAAIYPPIWDREHGVDDSLGYCLAYYADLKAFVDAAAARGLGLVISIS